MKYIAAFFFYSFIFIWHQMQVGDSLLKDLTVSSVRGLLHFYLTPNAGRG